MTNTKAHVINDAKVNIFVSLCSFFLSFSRSRLFFSVEGGRGGGGLAVIFCFLLTLHRKNTTEKRINK